MSERKKGPNEQATGFAKEAIPAVLKGVAAGVGIGAIGLVGTVALSHRERTHSSAKLHPLLVGLFELEQKSYGMDNTIWASVHRIHHHIPDATLYPFLRVSRLVDQVGIEDVPDTFRHLDPFVEAFTLDEVMEIGRQGEKLVRERMGDEYRPPTEYSPEEINAVLYPNEAQYHYPDYPNLSKEYSQEEIVRILTTDPHSPALVPPKDGSRNGVRGIFRYNVPLYGRPSNVFKAKPHLKPEDLQREGDVPRKDYTPYVVGSFVATSAAAFLLRGKYSLKDLVIAAAAGSAANGVRMYTGAALGGKVTNAFGHMGEATARDFLDAVFRKEYQIKLNPDGTVSTNTVNAGILGRLSAYLTADEVGGQDAHHKYPENIAYTVKEGNAAILDAPWGSLTAFLAKSGIPLLSEGDQFGGIDKSIRPDMPNDAMEVIHAARVKDMKKTA